MRQIEKWCKFELSIGRRKLPIVYSETAINSILYQFPVCDFQVNLSTGFLNSIASKLNTRHATKVIFAIFFGAPNIILKLIAFIIFAGAAVGSVCFDYKTKIHPSAINGREKYLKHNIYKCHPSPIN